MCGPPTAPPPSSGRSGWGVLDDLEALQPTYVVAGHRTAGAPTDLTAITHTRDYLELFEKTVADAANAADAEASPATTAATPRAGSATSVRVLPDRRVE